tara:strand:+ start:260 stop:706 length:447 start_codon:yes stop_codon:yes gene_type:complete
MKNLPILILFLLHLSGCGPRAYFNPIENSDINFESRGKGCSIEMLLYDIPLDQKYDELGKCTGSYHGYSKKSYDKVLQAIKDCACEIGGNAIVYTNENETYTYDYLGQITQIHTSATVLYFYETDYLNEIETPEIEYFDDEFEYYEDE